MLQTINVDTTIAVPPDCYPPLSYVIMNLYLIFDRFNDFMKMYKINCINCIVMIKPSIDFKTVGTML